MKKECEQEVFVNHAEQQLEEQLQEVISVFQNLPEERLLKPASDGGWSVLECIEHLNSYADFYLPRMEKALKSAPAVDQKLLFKHSFFGRYFINLMDPDKGKKKYKAIKKHRPVSVGNPYYGISRFIQHMENMLEILRASKHKELRKIFTPTSLSSLVKINLGDAFLFLLAHNRRHLRQAKRNLS